MTRIKYKVDELDIEPVVLNHEYDQQFLDTRYFLNIKKLLDKIQELESRIIKLENKDNDSN